METNSNTDRTLPVLAIVTPCYNEEEALPLNIPRILAVIDQMLEQRLVSPKSYILCVDDGSRDGTWEEIEQLHAHFPRVAGISLAHNRGQQAALIAGMEQAIGHGADCVITMDIDLQDDPQAIVKMVQDYHTGSQIVFGVRNSRQTDTWFKRNSARAFYRLQQKMGVETVYDHSEFRLMSRRAIEMLLDYGESNFFIRSLVAQLGLKTSIVTYDRAARTVGTTKYDFGKLVNLSIDGITAFSAKPMRLIFYTGFILLLADILIGIYVLVSLSRHVNISGWASLILSVWFLGSLILMAIGVVGEYIGKIFIEVKRRPRYHIDKRLFADGNDN